MRIVVCGSMAFAKEMLKTKKTLEEKGHFVFLPDETVGYAEEDILIKQKQVQKDEAEAGARRKIEMDLIRKHYEKIKNSDAILVLNHERRGIKGYIGGNTFLELGFAHVHNKPIYLINDIPLEPPYFLEEIKAMRPLVLNGDLDKIWEV